MLKLIPTAAAALLLSVGFAQSQEAKGGPVERQPAAESAIAPEPAAITKWFGQAVDNILSSADPILNDKGDAAPAVNSDGGASDPRQKRRGTSN